MPSNLYFFFLTFTASRCKQEAGFPEVFVESLHKTHGHVKRPTQDYTGSTVLGFHAAAPVFDSNMSNAVECAHR